MRCIDCRHFYISWDARFPLACKMYEIKSKVSPSEQVMANTGLPCLAFEAKIKRVKNKNTKT